VAVDFFKNSTAKKLKKEMEKFLIENLKLELHQQKSKIFSLSRGVDFVGFRIFYYIQGHF